MSVMPQQGSQLKSFFFINSISIIPGCRCTAWMSCGQTPPGRLESLMPMAEAVNDINIDLYNLPLPLPTQPQQGSQLQVLKAFFFINSISIFPGCRFGCPSSPGQQWAPIHCYSGMGHSAIWASRYLQSNTFYYFNVKKNNASIMYKFFISENQHMLICNMGWKYQWKSIVV